MPDQARGWFEHIDWRRPAGHLRLLLGGDVMTGRGIDQLFAVHNDEHFGRAGERPATQYLRWSAERHGAIETPVDHEYIWGWGLQVLRAARPDLSVVNLETSITTCSLWEPKTFHFRMHPANTGCLRAAGIECCVLANNHVMDFGVQGLLDTRAALAAAGIGCAGAGNTQEQAQQPYASELACGVRLLIFAFGVRDSGISPRWAARPDAPGINYLANVSVDSVRRMIDVIGAHRQPGDRVVVSLHWGANWVPRVPDAHRAAARALIDHAGVDVVHGHSAHHPLAVERYRGKLIVYGCGDLMNDYEGHPGVAGRPWPPDLGVMLFADLDAANGCTQGLRVIPVQRRKFRLERPDVDASRKVLRMLTGQGHAA